MGTRLLRLPVAVAAASLVAPLMALVMAAPPVFGAYPPGPFPGPAPVGTFPTVLMSRTVCATGDTLVASAGASNVRLEVPAGAFVDCIQVTIYAVAESIVVDLLPDGYSVIDAFAVGWGPDAIPAAALTLTITNSAIAPDATAFQTTVGGLSKSTDATVSSGHVVASFSHAIGIVVAGQQDVEAGTGQPSPLPSTDAGESSGSTPLILALAVIALCGAAFGLLLFVRRPRQR